MYLLAFLHVSSRRVWVFPATAHPTATWVEQQARNLCMTFQEQDVKPTYLIRDGDAKYTRHFDAIFNAEGVEVQKLPRQSPNLNAHVERFIRSVKTDPTKAATWRMCCRDRYNRRRDGLPVGFARVGPPLRTVPHSGRIRAMSDRLPPAPPRA